MSDNKMTPEFFTTLPWRIACRSYMNCHYFITGKDGDRELKIFEINDGPHPIKEHRDRMRDNSEAIVSAVNSTWGSGINPEAVPELMQLLKDIVDAKSYVVLDRLVVCAKKTIDKAKLL